MIMFLNPVLPLDSKKKERKKDINAQMFIPESLNSLLLKRAAVSRKMLQDYTMIERFRKH